MCIYQKCWSVKMKRRRTLTDEQDAYLREIAEGKSVQQCTDLLNARFGTTFRLGQIRSYKSNHGITSGMHPWDFVDHSQKKITTKEQDEFLHANYEGISNEELTKRFNTRFNTDFTVNQIKDYKARNKLDSGLTGRYEKGHTPVNKGTKGMFNVGGNKTSFKKGIVPANRVPISTEKERADGYVWVKVRDGHGNGNWVLKHVKVWEEVHGPVTKGSIVIFLDGDTHNFNIDNLQMISKATNARLNQNHLRYPDKELTSMGITIAEVIEAAATAKKRRNQ